MNKSDTPRSDAVPHNVANLGVFARQLERELNVAVINEAIAENENHKLQERIKKLEQAGDRLAAFTPPFSDRYGAWIKAKEKYEQI